VTYSYGTEKARLSSHPSTARSLEVWQPGQVWERMAPRWELPEALAAGTIYLQQQGERWLPREPEEQDASYAVRLGNSMCPPYMLRLENMLAGLLCRQAIRLEDVPDNVREQLFNVDLQGNDLDAWMYAQAKLMIRYGHIGTLVDMPREADADDTRPYWIGYTPRDILGWRTAVEGGSQRITELRLREEIVLPYEGAGTAIYGEEAVTQIRVLRPGSFELWRSKGGRTLDFDMVDSGPTTLQQIPFAVAYSNRVGLLESVPALEEVAWLNLAAYRRTSDLANQLHIAAVPKLFLYGWPGETQKVEMGPGYGTAAPADARGEYLEPAGTSYQYQFQHLELLEKQIKELGLATVHGEKAVAESGTSKEISRSQGDGTLMSIALQLQDMIDSALRYHGEYLGLPPESVGRAMVNTEFTEVTLDATVGKFLHELRTAGDITQETMLISLASRKAFYDDFDVDRELEETAQQQAEMQAQREEELKMMMEAQPPAANGKTPAVGQPKPTPASAP
jgi:Domain of unknown function (DUF4055)